MKRSYLYLGLLLTFLISGIELYRSLSPTVEVAMKPKTYRQSGQVPAIGAAISFEVEFDKKEAVRGNVTMWCQRVWQISDIPQVYVFTVDGFKGIETYGWMSKAIFSLRQDDPFSYDGLDGYSRGIYMRQFSFDPPYAGKYHFVVFFPSGASGDAKIDIMMTAPSLFATWWPLSSRILTFVGAIIAIAGTILPNNRRRSS